MNDPEIIEKLNEIKRELSEIKDAVDWYRIPFGFLFVWFCISMGALFSILIRGLF